MKEILEKARVDAVDIFQAGLKAVEPGRAIQRFCERQGDLLRVGKQTYNLKIFENIYLVGAGKATAPMAAAMEVLLGDRLTAGMITVKYGHTADLKQTQTVEAGHPVPDRNGESGSQKILKMAHAARENDLLICLFSGGGSALSPKAVAGVTLADKQATTGILLACGATIHEINTIRKHVSEFKGGGLALAAAPATLVSLILSDVVGDDLDVIASGPTVPDHSTYDDCLGIIAKYDIESKLPSPVIAHLKKGASGEVQETPKEDHPAFIKTTNTIIGSNIEALCASQARSAALGYQTLILSSMIEGETADIARMHAAIAREIMKTGHPTQPPACILSGGETTVRLTGKGLGGRNQEFVLCAVEDIAGEIPMVVLSGGTDGNDGPTDAAGAIADNATLKRASEQNLDVNGYLANNDSYHFFQALGDLVITGPTNTNVMDLRILLIPELN